MSHRILGIASLTFLLTLGCDDGAATPDAAARLDATGLDTLAEPDAQADPDAAVDPDATIDPDAATEADSGGPVDVGTLDAATRDAAALDAGLAPNDCVAGGGDCVPVVPGSCATGIVGDATWYSCGDGLGVVCCLPRSTPPVCRNVGTRSEGWYRPDGALICSTSCDGATVRCENVGTRSEGWYATPPSAACGSIPVEGLVEWTFCAP
jgi:hypothetical protein